ncbi:acyl-CoA dehydrogenase family protein [Mycobacterium asiaticum]|nr:acyl-CoA dehydrogenase family protein [Mycobacterium asiaticum]
MAEVDDFRRVVRDYLTKSSPSGTVRALMATESGYDQDCWRQMAGELGLHGIAVPQRWGGAGAGIAELAVVFEEMGRALLCSPFFATVALATQAVLASGDDAAAQRFVPGFIDGSSIATLILNGRLGAWDPAAVTLRADRFGTGGTGYRIYGDAPLVIDGHIADVVLAAANTDAGISLLAVRAGSEGVRRTLLAGLDRTRKIARVQFDGAPAEAIGADGAAANFLARTSDLAIVVLAAEQVGAAQRCLDMAVDNAKNRIQFGRPIGSFQAIKHRCADMLVQVEGARSAASHAADVAGTDGGPTAASVAKMVCSEAFLQVALDNMRIHGGIGFTWEHDAHLFVRRAKATQLIFGDPDYHAQRLAALVAP